MKTGKKNIVLIGMPGAGKSTVGKLLAKNQHLDFIDTDDLIRQEDGPLQEIINHRGQAEFRRIEERVLTALDRKGTVIATGGSAVYSSKAMETLKRNGITVYLSLSPQELEKRIKDMDTRGMVIAPGFSLADLLEEREPLYLKYADIIIDCTGQDKKETATAIAMAVSSEFF